MTDIDDDLLTMLDLYGATETAYQAWGELKFWREHGQLPDDAWVIEKITLLENDNFVVTHRDLKASRQ